MTRIDGVLDGGDTSKNELTAMEVMIRAVRASYVMVREADVEALERELEKLEDAAGEAAGPGYEVEEGPPR